MNGQIDGRTTTKQYGCFTSLIVLWLSVFCVFSGWSAVCDNGIAWSSLGFPSAFSSIIRMFRVRAVVYVCSSELFQIGGSYNYIYEPRHEISNYVVCATSKGSDQLAHTRSLIRVFASRLNILFVCLFVCLFDLILYVPQTIFQLYMDGSSWVEPVLS